METKKVLTAIILGIVLACAFLGFLGYKQVLKDNPNFWEEFNAQQNDAAYQAQRAAEDEADFQKVKPYIFGAIALFAAAIFLPDVLRAIGKPLLIVIGAIAILGAIAYFVGYADKNADGQADVMAVRMIQPDGTDAEKDATYSQTNNVNASATMKNTVSVVTLWIAFTICVFLIGFVAQFFKKDEL